MRMNENRLKLMFKIKIGEYGQTKKRWIDYVQHMMKVGMIYDL